MDIKLQNEIATEVWDSHGKEEYRQDQSHWRGVGRWVDDKKWKSIGNYTLRKIKEAFKLVDKDFDSDAPYVVLEWGPGGGANMYAFKAIASEYIGVDLSLKNLNEADRMISAEGFLQFKPIHLKTKPEDCLADKKNFVDIFVSTSVFQHFPSKEYGNEVLQAVHRLMKKKSLGMIQIRYDDGNPKWKPINDVKEYKDRHLTANSYRLEEFWTALVENNFEPLVISNINTNCNYATYLFRK